MPSSRHLISGDVLKVAKGGVVAGTRPALNLVEGSGVTLTVADNPAQDRVDVTVTASGGGGAGVSSFNTRTGAVTLTEADVEAALSGVAFGASQLQIGGLKVVGTRQGAIADLSPTYTPAEARTAMNAVLAALRAHGLIAP